jgi:hypothetical protein
VVGVACGLAAAGLLSWQASHGFGDPKLVLAGATAVAAGLLAIPVRALAGAFALTLTLSVAGLTLGYFLIAPLGASPPGASAALEDPLGEQLGGVIDGGSEAPAEAPAEAPTATSTSTPFGHAGFVAPVAGRRGWEAGTPCHSRLRTYVPGSAKSPLAKGACELRPVRDR